MGQDDRYPAIEGLMHLIKAINNGAADGTGIKLLVDFCHHLAGPNIPPIIVQYNVSIQNNIFGNYPTDADFAPCVVFAIVFGLLGFCHLGVFIFNYSRGHYFWLSVLWFIYGMMRVIGWALRIVWGHDITRVQVGLTDEVFLIIPSIILVSVNLILAQRLFTWRHPVGGSRRLFWNFMFATYGLVVVVIIITILASFIPYLHYISKKAYMSYIAVVMASAILIILYSLTAISLIALSYFFKPTRKDENLYTYQPWWIESFSPFYFVRKNAAQEAEETFMKRNHNHRHAIRVIAATHHHHNMVEGLTNERGNLKHNISLLIICTTTLFIFVGAIGRCVAVYQHRYKRDSSPICHPIAMYICWGVLEAIINILYLVGRVDLRFYRPDILPAKVRAIITAEQSYYPSSAESDDDEYTDDFDLQNSKRSGADDLYNSSTPSDYDDLHFQNQKFEQPPPPAQQPPYPTHDTLDLKKTKNDNDSEEFFF